MTRRTDEDYLQLAERHPLWVQTRADFALEDIELGREAQIRAGRLIAGDATPAELLAEIDAQLGLAKHRPTLGLPPLQQEG